MRSIRDILLAAAVALPCAARAGVDFQREIQPFLAEHCLECHGPDDSKGGLVLTSFEGAARELDSGARGIVPGSPDASEMLRRILSDDPKEQMPPPKHRAKHPVTEAHVAALTRWIAEGAEFQAHWAYQPVAKPAPPDSQAHPIDAFIHVKLGEHGIQPAAEADRITLLRRVHYDLLGLPPAPEEAEAFLNDRSPRAYEAMVDRALASEHFGERWGRHWLDMARYADSDGYEKDRARPDAWRYRDWVIRAINDDMPFDQFTIEQLAGDLLPDATEEQVVATAFNRQTLTNTEGGTDQEEFRVEACYDRTETLGTVWLGLTVGCARCHTHKYDEITQHEYFQLFAFFNNADEVTRQAPVSEIAWRQYEADHGEAARSLIPLKRKLDAARNQLRVKLPEWEVGVQARLAAARANPDLRQTFTALPVAKAKSAKGLAINPQADGSLLATGTPSATDTHTLTITGPLEKPLSAIRLEVLADASLPSSGPGLSKNGNFVLSSVSATLNRPGQPAEELVLHSPAADYNQDKFPPSAVLDGKPETGWAVGGGTGKDHHLTLQLAAAIHLGKGEQLVIKLDHQYTKSGSHILGKFRLLAASEETEASIAPPEVIRILNEEPKRRNPVVIQALHDWMEKTDPSTRAAAATLADAQAKLPKPPVMDVRVIGQRSSNPRETRVLLRGDFLSPGDPVSAGTLGVLPPLTLDANDGEPTRLDLARWLTRPDHPLTPRVTVNHVWTQLFGQGLVKTVADFGVRGDPPTHPELLDWLASRFIDQGWSRKKLLRLILTSATYKQSSDPAAGADGPRSPEENAKLRDLDPLNTLLWRQNRLRVQGEIVRDLHLAASGLLSRNIGGPSVFPPMPKDVADLSYAGNFKWAASEGGDRYRRGMYTFFKRTAPHPELMTFDCPDANVTNVQRTVSNTPLQALTTLNAEAFVEAARALAENALDQTDTRPGRAHLDRAFRACLTRAPSDAELDSLEKLLDDAIYHYKEAPQEEISAITGGQTGPRAAAVAALTAVTRIILNLDEFITRG